MQLWLYFNVFRKSDLWQYINDAILPFFSAKFVTFWAMQQLSAKVSKLSFEYLQIYSPKSGDFLAEKNSKIASLMHCQRSDLQKTLKYSQSRDLEGIR